MPDEIEENRIEEVQLDAIRFSHPSILTTDTIRLFINDMMSFGDMNESSNPTIKHVEKEGKVRLYENDEVKYVEDCVYIHRIRGWFLKNDIRIFKDYCNPKEFIIVDANYKRNYNVYAIIANKLDSFGNPDLETLEFGSNYESLVKNLAAVIITNENNYIKDFKQNILDNFFFVTDELYNSKEFKYFYKESLKDGYFRLKNDISINDLEKNHKTQYRKHKLDVIHNFKNYVKNKPITYNQMQGKKYTFGLELETSSGFIPERFDSQLFYSCVHDGSLRDDSGNNFGGEYVTDVLYSDLGLLQTKKLANELSKRCFVNYKCGLHTHIGGATFNKENIILMYHLYKKLEKDIFLMLPPSRRNNEYCRPLKKLDFNINNLLGNERKYHIDYYYDKIIEFISNEDYANSKINKKNDHPRGFKCGYDHSSARYCWVNFVPAVFNTRKKPKGNEIYTIEFRNHSGTTSYYKIKNWLFICIALVDIIENHKSIVYANFDNLNLKKIVEVVYPKIGLKINNYIDKRINKFSDNTKDLQQVEEIDYNDNEVDSIISIKNL